MKNRIIIITALLTASLTGCSYVSDMIEGAISQRSSFSAEAAYDGSDVTVTWDAADSDSDFAGFEIYRTSQPNDEYSTYITVADRFLYTSDGLDSTSTVSFTYNAADVESKPGKYFYRVGVIYWDDPVEDRDVEHGYIGDPETDYNDHTSIESISGYAEVTIP